MDSKTLTTCTTSSTNEHLTYTYNRVAFCTVDNVDSCIRYVNHSLAALGMDHPLILAVSKQTEKEVVRVVNVLYALVQQRHKDLAFRDQTNETIHRLQFDMDHLNGTLVCNYSFVNNNNCSILMINFHTCRGGHKINWIQQKRKWDHGRPKTS
jgi:hypothetical protein